MKRKFQLSFFVLFMLFNANAFADFRDYEADEVICNDKIIMNFDRNEYVSGENIFFKINCVNYINNHIATESKFAYVELINPAGYSIERKKISLDSGSGFGSVSIPDSASTGMYNIIAYTNCMKSLGSNAIYQGSILIYNPERAKFYKTDIESSKKNIQVSYENNAIVKGLGNTIYYKLIGDIKDTITVTINDESGYILNSAKSTRAVGSITFIPVESTLVFKLITKDTVFSVPIPEIEEEGVNVKLLSDSKTEIKLQIQSTNLHRKLSYDYKLYDEKGELLKNIFLSKEKEIFEIDHSKFFNGNNKLVLKNNNNVVIWERPIYIEKENNPILISNLKQEVEEREKVTVSLILDNKIEEKKYADISLSVRKINHSIKDQREQQINQAELSNLNVLFIQEPEVGKSLGEKIYLNEHKGSLLSGRVLNSDGTPLIDNNMFLCFPDSFVNTQVCKSNDKGEFHFYINNDKIQRDIVINANNGNKNLTILINSNFLNNYSFVAKKKLDINDEYQEYLKKLYYNLRIQNVYNQDYLKVELNKNAYNYTGNFYEEPDEEYYFDDFVSLDSIHEYFYELIKGVRVTEIDNKPEFRVVSEKTHVEFQGNPAVFVDGVYIDNVKTILDISPELCYKIEVVRSPIILNSKIAYGLVSLITKSSKLKNIDLSSNSTRIEYSVYDPSEKFVFEGLNNDIPDFRNTLYWNPEIILNNGEEEKIEFYTGDDNSWYELNIRGITNTGQEVSESKIFKVGNPQ